MDILKELDEVKNTLWGLDKAAVQDFIGEILKECEKDKDNSMSDLVRQNQTLQTELKECKDHLQDLKEQNRELLKNMGSMSEAVEKGTEYTRERDRELDEYKKREKEIETLLEDTRKEAYEERSRILEEAEAKRSSLLEGVEEEKAALLSGAKKEADEILQKARAEADCLNQEADLSYQELLERSVRVRKYLDEMKNRMMLLFSWEEEHLDTELEEAGVQMEEPETPVVEESELESESEKVMEEVSEPSEPLLILDASEPMIVEQDEA